MIYDFDAVVNRKKTCAVKWDGVKDIFGQEEILPLWIADMDFWVPEAVNEAIKNRMEHAIYGYTRVSDEFYQASINWIKRRHGWQLEKEWLVQSPGVVPALALALKAFTKPGDKVLLQSPIYPPFFPLINDSGRVLVDCPLIVEDGKYVMDFANLEKALDGVKAILFCNPHNPVGRVWTKEELTRLGEMCKERDILIISDEIWSDLIFEDYKHTPFASFDKELSQRIISCIAPSKTFNVAGLKTSVIIIPNEELLKGFKDTMDYLHIGGASLFGQIALEAAYNNSEPWLNQLLQYLRKNMEYLVSYVENNIPSLKILRPEGTFVGWLDCRALGLDQKELRDFMINEAKVGLNNGVEFGQVGRGFQRINYGCPRAVLTEGLERIERAVGKLNNR